MLKSLLGDRTKTLREDQDGAIMQLREAVAAGERRIIMQGPPGFGKTLITANIVERARAKGKRVIITVPVLSLVDQTVDVLNAQGIDDIGVIQADHQLTNSAQPIQVASVQTLMKRLVPESDIVVIDEVHKWYKFYEKWLLDPAWATVPIIGTTATPWTKGLGAYFHKLIVANTITNMIRQKTLAPFRVFAPAHPDLSDVRTVAGDYHEGDLHKVMGKSKLVADVVETWKVLGEGRPTIVFAVNRAHADQLRKEFQAAGVPAGYMDCDSSLQERMIVRAQLLGGQIKVVCNVDVIGLGVDWPEISCIVLARPTKSETRYYQNVGRGLRIHKGKTDLIVIDHSDTTLTLGYISDIHHDELDDGKKSLTASKVIALPKECPECHFVKPPRTAKCPNCGFIAQKHAEPIKPAAGQLLELNGEVFKVSPVAKKLGRKDETYGQLVWYAAKKRYNKGWAANKYRAIYGVFPRGLDYMRFVQPPSAALASWIKSQNIRWAKSKRKQRWDSEVVNGATGLIPGTLMTEEDRKYI